MLRLLRTDDIPFAMDLKEAAGWNQTEDDWRLLLELIPEGCFALEEEGRVIATSTALPYGGSFGWVGMVLVHPRERRKGHGTRMLREALSSLERRGIPAALDATPEGRPIYELHGFGDVCGVERWVGTVRAGQGARGGCHALTSKDLPEVLPLDRESFGADRAAMLDGFLRRPGARGWVARPGEGPERSAEDSRGYLIARPGTRFTHLGPWVASSPAAARRLWETALSAFEGRVVGVDILVPNEEAGALAAAAGLVAARTLFRMVRPPRRSGTAAEPPVSGGPVGGRADRVYGLAGFEWG